MYLGNIDLDQPWRDLDIRLTHVLLMSRGGGKANKVKRLRNLDTEIERFEDELQR